MRRRSRLVRRLLVVEVVTVLATVLIAAGVSGVGTASLVESDATARMLGLARTVAASPGVAPAVGARDSAALEPAAEAVRLGADASFVTIMTPDGTRLTHPDRSLIGQTYQGTFLPAAHGETVVETFPGTLGPSVRAIVPITASSGGPVIGMAAVGLLRVDVAGRVLRELGVLALGAIAAIGIGVGLAIVAARRVRRDTLGLEPAEITALHRHHEAVLHAMREGLLVLDEHDRLAVVNDEAARLLGLDPATGLTGRTLADLGVDPALAARLADPSPVGDETVLVGERLLLLNRTRADDDGSGRRAWVVTLRDRTEVEQVMRALDDARSVAGALRFQAHEHANHLQAVATLIELGAHDDARDLAVRWSRDISSLGEDLRARIADPALAALVLDKATDARDRGLELRITPDTAFPAPVGDAESSDDHVTVLGNLLDNALDAALEGGGSGVVELDLSAGDDALVLRVADDGPGLADPDAAFAAGWSTKAGPTAAGARGLGLALVARVVARRGGTVRVEGGLEHDGGRGTTFVVTLPRPSAAQPVADAAHGHDEAGDAQV
ncbi:sensor histidine kinase [Actinomycetospora endophytica]|uniref:histidine kinase n=1 Tax=Actinomycetospora endophytica TaxID=2291215 RepID=A0ABS8P7X3_9PSEU|nr:sensor histidine kinase [Actinomycetospora endophytica]MCD2194363.1 sensor histidine kinase [Actinomycetospora endophytica]